MTTAAPRRTAALGLALALALAAALVAAGCGSGGGGTSTTAGSTSTSATTSTPTAPSTSPGGGSGAEAGSHSKAESGGRSESGAPRHSEPGGEKSIEDYGSEAAGSGREALLTAFHGYLGALGAKDYTTACNYLAASVRRSLEQFVVPRLKAKGCPAILPKLLSPTAAAIARQQANGRVTKVRVRGSRAFVVYHAPGARLYMLTMTREGGGWKAALVAGSVLVPSAATLGR